MSFFSKKEERNVDVAGKIAKSKEELSQILEAIGSKTGIDLSKVKVRVVVVIDHSLSMKGKYEQGIVQEVLDMFLPFALQFDDDGEIQVYIFDDSCKRLKTNMSAENYEDYVRREIIKPFPRYGGTCYSRAVQMVDEDFDDEESKKIPTIVFFVTDGDCEWNDESRSNVAFVESSKHGIFFALIGVGNKRFDYLRQLDDLRGRPYDNTGFMHYTDFKEISSVTLFTKALKDFVPWLKAKGYVK